MSMTLEEIGAKYDTDKLPHSYLRHYAARFGGLRREPITLLEIGTWQGAGVRTFREFFDHPDAKIVGIDHKPEWLPGPDDRIIIEIGKQEDVAFQDDFGQRHGPFDVVIDDGGHQPHQHLASLEALWPHVKPGGWYVIEDLHSIFNPCWNPTLQEWTILDWIREQGQAVLVGGSDCIEIHIVGGNWNDGLIFLRKRNNAEAYTPEKPV
jgi:hypothetical protein